MQHPVGLYRGIGIPISHRNLMGMGMDMISSGTGTGMGIRGNTRE